MTCESVVEHLLTRSTGTFGDLQAHLSTCPSCARLAAAVWDSEQQVRQHVESFVTTNTLDAQWAAALDTVGPDRRATRWLIGGLLAVAGLLVVATALPPPGGGSDPGSPVVARAVPPALLAARDSLAEFEAIDVDISLDDLDRKEQDRLLTKTLSDKAGAMQAAEAALVAARDQLDPEWGVAALADLAELYAAMGDAILALPHPPYLTEQQDAVYTGALYDKAEVQWTKALRVVQAARTEAEGHGLPTAALVARAAELSDRLDAIPQHATPIPEQGDLGEAFSRLGLRLGACEDRLTPEVEEEVVAALGAAARILEASPDAEDPGALADLQRAAAALDRVCRE